MSIKKRILILLFVISLLFLNQQVFAQDNAPLDLTKQARAVQVKYKDFLANLRPYERIMDYLAGQKKAKDAAELNIYESIIFFAADLLFSLFCLWLTILLFTVLRKSLAKRMLWFFFIFNVTWFAELFFFKLLWRILDYLIVSLRTDLGVAYLEHFPILIIVFTILAYIWLLARTFSLNFFGALKVFFVAHLIYFVAISMVLLVPGLEKADNSRLRASIEQTMGLGAVTRSYIADSANIFAQKNILFMIRPKPYHI